MLLPKYNNFNQVRKIGEYEIHLPDPPDLKSIANKGIVQHKQVWDPIELPKGFERLPNAEKTAFKEQMWEYRAKGYWFWNNGNLEYLTGQHWFFLNWWRLPKGLPHFIDAQRDFFYLWKFGVENDKHCSGLVLVSDRRFGKTAMATSLLYETITRTDSAKAGIQSKTDQDAKKIYFKILYSWKRLPSFFKPVDEGDTYPKSGLVFAEPKKRTSKGEDKTYGDVLDSEISYESSAPEAYDGDELVFYYSDEFGKTKKANVYEREGVVRECLMDGGKIVGLDLWTTTVEEMEKGGGKNAKLIWDEADPATANKLGRTTNLKKRWFKSASYGMKGDDDEPDLVFFDAYGYSDVAAADRYLDDMMKNLKGEALLSKRRKYPRNLKDAFQTQASINGFPIDLIWPRKEYLEANTFTRKVNFYRDEKGEVRLRDSELGRWKICWDFNDVEKESNRVVRSYNNCIPQNNEQFRGGADPFAMSILNHSNGKGSMAAAYIFRILSTTDPENTGLPVCQYLFRQPSKHLMWDDLIMMCEYYGCKINIEDNVNDFVDYFPAVGKGALLMKRPTSTIDPNRKVGAVQAAQKWGTPAADNFVIESHLSLQIDYANNYIHKIFFTELLDDWIEFDVNNRTEFDCAMAFGYTLQGIFQYTRPKRPEDEKQERLISLPRRINMSQT